MRRGRPPFPDTLTPREQEVLALLREGLTNEQIAERLGISFAGAKYHVSEILSKLYVSSREEAALWRPRERVFGVAFLGVLLKKLSAKGIMHLTAGAVLGASLSVIAVIAIGVGVMALREDEKTGRVATNLSPAPTSTVAPTTVASPTAAPQTPVPLPRFEIFDNITSYRAALKYQSTDGRVIEATVEVSGSSSLHAFLALPGIGDVEYILVERTSYTKVNGTWTTESVPGVNYSALREADIRSHLVQVKPNLRPEGQTDDVAGVPCDVMRGTDPTHEGGTTYFICYADDLPLRFVETDFGNTLTLELSNFNEEFKIEAPI